MGTEIEVLAVGNCFLRKDEQDPRCDSDYETQVRARLIFDILHFQRPHPQKGVHR